MPRPSLKDARRNQILDAAEVCVAHHGVDGLTLEGIAEEAGLARALIRHNVGNRDDVIEALLDRFLIRSQSELDELFAALPIKNPSLAMIELLFDPSYIETRSVLVADALVTYGAKHAETAHRMHAWTERAWADIGKILAAEHADSSQANIDAVAAGILGLYFNVESYTLLGPSDAIRNATKQAALILVETLAAKAG